MPSRKDIKKIMIVGSGPIVIGQACEFDYSGTQACKALRGLGYEIVLVNSNPATIMIMLKLGWDWWSNPSAFSLSGFYLIINLIAALVYLSYFSPGKSSQPAALLEAET